MEEGIKINDIGAEMSSDSLEALLAKKGGGVTLTRLDLELSQDGLNALLQRCAPEGSTPSASLEAGKLTLGSRTSGGEFHLELHAGSLKLEIGAGGLRLRTETGE